MSGTPDVRCGAASVRQRARGGRVAMNYDLVGALEEIARDRGVSKETLIEALEAALISAYRRHYGTSENVVVRLDRDSGRVRVFVQKRVVESVEDPDQEVSLAEAREIHPGYEVGDVVEREVELKEFGRIAAQTAKQVVVQRIREAERDLIYDEYIQREGDIVTGIVQRVQGRHVFVDLGRIESVLLPSEQIPGEFYRPGDRIKVLIVEVKKTNKGPQVVISRSHPNLVKRLFELEVPEIHDGVVEIVGIAREGGGRTKIAVTSRDEKVDPVGACVGQKGMRVQAVVSELHGEKIDIIKWSKDPVEFITNALSPARVTEVQIDEEEKAARVIVPDHQLSLAIGRAGQNARLAAKLTGWRIDIKSESQVTDEAMRAALRGAEAGTVAWVSAFKPAGHVSDIWERAWAEALSRRAARSPGAGRKEQADVDEETGD